MLQIDSWRAWEVQAENVVIQNMQDGIDEESTKQMLTKRQSSVILAWSKSKVFIWMVIHSSKLCPLHQYNFEVEFSCFKSLG
ncbi:hypothetical protein DsansV1_C04g0037431 [Dioscorea sansibarensis]